MLEMDTEVGFYRRGGCVVADLDPVPALALAGLLQEISAEAGIAVPDLMAHQVEACLMQPVTLNADSVDVWLRTLMRLRVHLARTLGVFDLPREVLATEVGHLAAESPVQGAARAFWWTGVLLEGLAAALP